METPRGSRWAQGGVCSAVSGYKGGGFGGLGGPRAGCVRQFRGGAAAEHLDGWQAAAYMKARRATAEGAERWQGWQGAKHVERSVPMAGCVRQFQSGTIEVVPRSVGGDRNVQPRRVWRVRWAQGVVCLAVAERCNRGAAKGLERSSCRAVGRSVCRDGERKAIWQWTQSGHRSGK